MPKTKDNSNEKTAQNNAAIFSWTLYDFGNSAFTTLVVTFIYSTFFTTTIAQNSIDGTVLWARAITISSVMIALFSPIMGALADKANLRKTFLVFFTLLCAISTLGLYTALPGEVLKALAIFIVANFAFEMGIVFYNAYLPDIAPTAKVGRISGYGWAFGYVGGLGCLVIAMVGFVDTPTPWFGFTKNAGENIRATNILVAAWFLIFSTPALIWLKSEKAENKFNLLKNLQLSLLQLSKTFTEIRKYKNIFYFLLARIFYNDGLITIFAFGGIYAAGTFNFTFEEIMIFGIVLNVAAGLGAFIFGYFDDLLGSKTTIQISNLGLVIAIILAVVAVDKTLFWVAGTLVGIFSGPNQAASRSLLARHIPKNMENEFYGFYAFSGKATTFMGPLLFGIFTDVFQSQRTGMAFLLLFFILGIAILSVVKEKPKSVSSN